VIGENMNILLAAVSTGIAYTCYYRLIHGLYNTAIVGWGLVSGTIIGSSAAVYFLVH